MCRWRLLLAERVAEATTVLGSVPGVRGIVVAGSVGRGEPWPMSDIDLVPIRSGEAATEVERRRANLVDWWAASGRAQTLDVGWLAFSPEEVTQAVASDARWAAAQMGDQRWLHGTDKPYGGYGVCDPDGLADALARWATAVRFHPEVVGARVAEWERQARTAQERALAALRLEDRIGATIWLREVARALRLVLVEHWRERLSSMGREWTRFERMAERHGAAGIAGRIAVVAGVSPGEVLDAAERAPVWLRERIERCYVARREVGEEVTAEENARDQIAAFRVHVVRRRSDLTDEWLGLPDPRLDVRLAELEELFEDVGALVVL
jgi:predicted nucleotidyltransferase